MDKNTPNKSIMTYDPSENTKILLIQKHLFLMGRIK
jgi:hypothetical protein